MASDIEENELEHVEGSESVLVAWLMDIVVGRSKRIEDRYQSEKWG